MDNANSGSFGAAIGGGNAIADAMARRGMGGGAPLQQQVSPSAPISEGAQLPQVPNVGGGTPTPTPTPQTQSTPAQPPLAPESQEAQMIIRALSSRLQTLSKMVTGGV